MTPECFIKDIGALVAANRGREALEFWRHHYSEAVPGMTSEQIVWIADLMHMADVASDIDEATTASGQVEPEPRKARLA